MPNKKVELILRFTRKKIFFKGNTFFFQKIALNQLRQAKITQTPWEKGSSKRHKPKFHLKKIKLHKICFNE